MRILIAADVRLFREGLALVLGGYEQMDVCAAVAGADAAEAAAAEHHPDVVLIDFRSARPEAIAAILDAAPGVKVVALSVPSRTSDRLAGLEAGVCGWVSSESSPDELVAALESADRHELDLGAELGWDVSRRLATLAAASRAAPPAPDVLTARQREVAGCVAEGLSNKQIASQLCIEVPTVKNHVHTILEKLGLSSRAQIGATVRTRD